MKGGKYLKITKKRIFSAFLFFIFIVVLIFTLISIPKPLFKNDYSTVVYSKDKQLLRVFLNSNEQWIFPEDENYKVPEKLEVAITTAEDKNFYSHFGIDINAIFRAIKQNILNKKVVSGASTITMQVARLIKPKKRTYFNKFIETIQALKIEIFYSKRDILRLYLQHAPFGGNVRGIEAASFKYYQKPPEKLTWSEACTLAVLPNAPGLISPDLNNKKLFKKKNNLLKKLLKKKVLSKWDYETAITEPVPSSSKKFPIIAPHLTREMHNKYKGKSIITTIDKNLQKHCLNLAKVHNNFLKDNGINNLSVIVAETKTGKVRVYIGSANFFDNLNNGQVDGAKANRSTGSILKPFLYGLSIDEGLMVPNSILKDIPTYYGAYSPTNADKSFSGIVTMEDALINSLNIPAARTLKKLGLEKFYDFLKKGGLTSLNRSYNSYGLPLVLGGAEANLVDLTKLYMGLGNYGEFQNLKFLEKGENDNKKVKLLSDGASFLILDTLKHLRRPGFEYYWQMYQNHKPIAWKTGTSYGQRDGWAIGVSKDYTVAVWSGNFSGEGNPLLTGASSSGPVLFDIFNFLPSNSGWFQLPKTKMKKITICKDSGYLAKKICPNTMEISVPFKMKPLKLCPYHKKITVTKNEKERVCSLCWEEGNYKSKTILQYPASVNEILRKRGKNVFKLPPHKKDCPGVHKDNVLEIIYPLNNAKIFIPTEVTGVKQKLKCKASHANPNTIIYWYLNGVYLGKTSKDHSQTIELKEKKNKILIIDEEGNESFVTFFAY